MSNTVFVDGDVKTKEIKRRGNTVSVYSYDGSYAAMAEKLSVVKDQLETLEDNDLALYFIRSKVTPVAESGDYKYYNIDDIIKAVKSTNIDNFVENNTTDEPNDLRDDRNHYMYMADIKGKLTTFDALKSKLLDEYVDYIEEDEKRFAEAFGYAGIYAKNAIKKLKPDQKNTLLNAIKDFVLNKGGISTIRDVFFRIAEMYEKGGSYRELFRPKPSSKLDKANSNTVKVKNGADLEQLFPMHRNDIPIGPQNERSGSGKIASVEVNGKTFELEMTTEENDEYWHIYGGGDEGEYYNEEDAAITYEIGVNYNGKEVASDVFYYNPMKDKNTYNKLYKDIITLIKEKASGLNESKEKTIYSKFL